MRFWERYPAAKNPLSLWHDRIREGHFRNFAELREVFPSADQVGRRTVFNIGGNKFRLIGRVNYFVQKVYVLRVMTHSEYDKDAWK